MVDETVCIDSWTTFKCDVSINGVYLSFCGSDSDCDKIDCRSFLNLTDTYCEFRWPGSLGTTFSTWGDYDSTATTTISLKTTIATLTSTIETTTTTADSGSRDERDTAPILCMMSIHSRVIFLFVLYLLF